MFLKENPFLRLLPPLLLGIITSKFFVVSNALALAVVVVGVLLVLGAVLVPLPYKWRSWLGLGAYLFLFGTGLYLHDTHTYFSNRTDEVYELSARLLEVPQKTSYAYKAKARLLAIKQNASWQGVSEKCLIYLPLKKRASQLKAGDVCVFQSVPSNPPKNRNPFDFNYKAYLENQGIHGVFYLKDDSWHVLEPSKYGLRYRALNYRLQLIALYERAGIVGKQLGVLSALTLGDKTGLDPEVKKAYAGAGAMHVLAVSGLHVGIVYFIILMLTRLLFLKRHPRIRYLIIIVMLWAYAILTGLSPSVTRAATMFSFILFGKVLGRKINVYNSLAAAAFFMLLLNPMLLFDVGFQLSFTAVVGIVFLFPYISSWFYFKSPVFRWVWQAMAVSISAQLATFPITMYYFHQFPVYFWLSNLVVLLGATALLYFGFMLIVLAPFEAVFYFLGGFINKLLALINGLMQNVSDLPHALIKPIYFDSYYIFPIYGVLIFGCAYLLKQKYRHLQMVFASILLLLGFNIYDSFRANNSRTMAVYGDKEFFAVHLLDGKTSTWLLDSCCTVQQKEFVGMVQSYYNTKKENYVAFGAESPLYPVFYQSGFLSFGGKTAFILNGTTLKVPDVTSSLKIDYLIVGPEAVLPPNGVLAKLKPEQIVLSQSIPWWERAKWDKITHIPIHSIGKDGAFLQELLR